MSFAQSHAARNRFCREVEAKVNASLYQTGDVTWREEPR